MRKVDPHDLTPGRDQRREAPAQRAGAARDVEHGHPGSCVDELDHTLPSASLASRHDLVEPALVRGCVPAEDGGKELLGLQRSNPI